MRLSTKLDPLLDRTLAQATAWLDVFMPELERCSFAHALRSILDRERAGLPLDRLADECASEVPRLLEREQPDVFAAYLALEIAAVREPDIFGPVYHAYREFILRAVLGAARRGGIEAQMAETSVPYEWAARGWHARLLDNRLCIELPGGGKLVLEPQTAAYDA